MNDNSRKVLSSLERQCSRREICSTDILRKCAGAGLPDEESREILASLTEGAYVDDGRYCSAFAREKSRLTGWGTIKIRMALSAKGLDRQVIDAALLELDSEESSLKLLQMLRAKYKSLQGDPQRRLKIIRFALSRGYEYSQVSELLPELEADDSALQRDGTLFREP